MSESTHTTHTKIGPAAGSGPLPALGAPDILLWYAMGARAALETMRAALELNRNLNDIGREVVRRAQDEAITSLLRGLTLDAAPRPPPEAGLVDLARMGFEAVAQSMAATTRAFDPAARATELPKTDAEAAPRRSRAAD